MHFDEYIELYHTADDWYQDYVDKELKNVKRRYKHTKINRGKNNEKK